MCKHALVGLALAALAAGCAPRPPLESLIRVSIDGGAPVDVRLSLSAERASQQARWTEAIAAAVRHHVRVLGPAPAGPFAVHDRRTGAVSTDAIDVAAPLWSSYRGMAVEAAVAQSVAQLFWRRASPCGAERAWLVDGLARYTAIAALASQNEGTQTAAAAGALEARYAGGFLPWMLRASVPARTAGSGVAAYRARPHIDPSQRASPADRAAGEAKTAFALQTLSNWLGGPTWEAVLRALAEGSAGRCASPRDLQAAALDVTGLDLSWFLDQALASGRIFDYAVERLASDAVAGAPDRYRTEIVVARRGDGVFSGTSQPPIAPYESGRGVEVAVQFADGSERIEHWDGRAVSRRFAFESSSRAVAAIVDPRGLIALDTNRTNNSLTTAPRAGAAARWTVLWHAWLEHLLLTYAALV